LHISVFNGYGNFFLGGVVNSYNKECVCLCESDNAVFETWQQFSERRKY